MRLGIAVITVAVLMVLGCDRRSDEEKAVDRLKDAFKAAERKDLVPSDYEVVANPVLSSNDSPGFNGSESLEFTVTNKTSKDWESVWVTFACFDASGTRVSDALAMEGEVRAGERKKSSVLINATPNPVRWEVRKVSINP